MRLTVVGCSGSLPGPGSPASCYLLEAEAGTGTSVRTWRLVLDLGSGSIGALQRYTALAGLDAVALSHLHPDHFLDVCGLYVALRYGPTALPAGERVVVHGPTATAHRLAAAYGLDPDPGMSGQLDVRRWTPGVAVHVGPMVVTPFRVEHPVEAYGFRVSGPSEREAGATVTLAYTGDTDSCAGLTDLSAGADLLLAEASFHEGRDTQRGVHLTGRRAGEAAAEGGAGRLVLTHLPPWNDPARSLAEARAVFDGPVEVASQGLVVRL